MSTLATTNPPAIYGSAVAGAVAQQNERAEQVKQELAILKKTLQISSLEMGDLLSETKSQRFYQGWGFSSFEEFVTESMEMKPRKAFYLITVVERSRQLNIAREKIENIAISKLREIFSLDPQGFFLNAETGDNEKLDGHIVRLVDLAPELSYEAIKAEVRRLKGIAEGEEGKWLNLFYKLDTYDTVIVPGLERMRMSLGNAGVDPNGDPIEFSDSYVIEKIIGDFLSDPNYQEEQSQGAAA